VKPSGSIPADTLSDTLADGRKRKRADESAGSRQQNQRKNTMRIAADGCQSFSYLRVLSVARRIVSGRAFRDALTDTLTLGNGRRRADESDGNILISEGNRQAGHPWMASLRIRNQQVTRSSRVAGFSVSSCR
jgi:hypothetical protein